jgi:LPS export ABC transporter permease LptG
MTILDRYVLKKFLVPFLYCFLGFIAIWLVFDLSDNGPDFIAGHASLKFILEFYASQLPQIIIISLPIGLLLAVLYSLTQMSRSNEIISMLGAGRSVARVLAPLFGIALVLVGAMMWFNYEGAPHAEKTKKEMLKELNSGRRPDKRSIQALMFRNRADHRTWYMRKIYPALQKLNDVQIIQQNPNGVILRQWYARSGHYDTDRHLWILEEAKIVDLSKDGDVTKTQYFPELRIEKWSETPWRLASATMNPDYLSVPELHDYLANNADFPAARLAPFLTQLENRWALPWSPLLVVLLAAPLGIVYSRRGILGSVSLALALFFGLIFTNSLFVALGKGDKMPPVIAVWAPFVFFLLVGFLLLWMRSTNRDIRIPKIFG